MSNSLILWVSAFVLVSHLCACTRQTSAMCDNEVRVYADKEFYSQVKNIVSDGGMDMRELPNKATGMIEFGLNRRIEIHLASGGVLLIERRDRPNVDPPSSPPSK